MESDYWGCKLVKLIIEILIPMFAGNEIYVCHIGVTFIYKRQFKLIIKITNFLFSF